MIDRRDGLIRSALSDESWDIEGFLRKWGASMSHSLVPFDEKSVAFVTQLSERLFRTPGIRQFPEVVVLAYWLRPQPVAEAEGSFRSLGGSRDFLMPRGSVFHIPPANVDTIFVYSWALSMLVGNANVVRLSDRTSSVVNVLLKAIRDLFEMEEFAPIAERNFFIHTGHDDDISRRLSATVDLRVVWGGDATVDHFRQFPLPVHGRDLAFPNRHSFAVLSSAAVALASDEGLSHVAERFFNDSYWFDQGGCSSPRLVIWDSPDEALAKAASRRFHDAVGQVVSSRGYHVTTGSVIEKMVMGFQTIVEQDVVSYETPTSEATWIRLGTLDTYSRENCGGGLFYEYFSSDLSDDLNRFVRREDQTVGHFGIEESALKSIVRRLNGRGVDRWVPVGQALDFDRYWDGYDLLHEFARRVVVVTDSDSGQSKRP